MKKRVLEIKHMVCARCVAVVGELLEAAGLQVHEVSLGKAVVSDDGDEPIPRAHLAAALEARGFALVQERSRRRVHRIKAACRDYLRQIEATEKDEEVPALSDFLADALHQHYASVSAHFSNEAGMTIEQYVIRLKIERVKQLLTQDTLKIKEIAWRLHYSSSAHLSAQFKQVTGQSPTAYRAHL